LVSSELNDSELLGVFENSLRLSNYENTFKKEAEEDEPVEKKDEEADSDEEDHRIKKVKKAIQSITLVTEDGSLVDSDSYNF